MMQNKKLNKVITSLGYTILYAESKEITVDQLLYLVKKDFQTALQELKEKDQNKILTELNRKNFSKGF